MRTALFPNGLLCEGYVRAAEDGDRAAKNGRARIRPGQKEGQNLQRGTPFGEMGGNRRTILPFWASFEALATNGIPKNK
ncbi:hypothetical protein NKI66_17895 [Mesorhizobium sp. M0518]|uniref:hypothetical protein n=1 Tax=Mesorhizobium sp. M0518 TaxID=2956956 RepID=UPI003335B093